MEVRIDAYVYAYYTSTAPTYRIWVDNNLYTEREFWPNPDYNLIEEKLIIDVDPGEHSITVEKVRPKNDVWVWIERLIIEASEETQDIGLGIKRTVKQVINFQV